MLAAFLFKKSLYRKGIVQACDYLKVALSGVYDLPQITAIAFGVESFK